jgi:cytosine/adenosine deaminase-related metal-dependent hydrolase
MNSWSLTGARVALGPRKSEFANLEIRAGRIAAIGSPAASARTSGQLDLSGCLVLPGLINSHDHLEFSLFPRLGGGPYANAGDWARDIYRPDQPPLLEILRIPLAARLTWGGINNLLSGVTTVCHHNRYYSKVFSREFPVRVPRSFGWAHSLEFCPDLRKRFRRTPGAWPFVIHAGEAVDRQGKQEVFQLDAMGALDSRTVLVHGVALEQRGLDLAKKRGASLVWCPSSNVFLLGKTLKASVFDSGIRMALGTDSAMTRQGSLLEEFRIAHRLRRVSSSRLYAMVTCDAAEIMRLDSGEGFLLEGGVADLLVVPDRGKTPAATVLKLRPGEIRMVMVGGQIKLASHEVADQVPAFVRRLLYRAATGSSGHDNLLLAVDVSRLLRETGVLRERLIPFGRLMSRTS